MYEYFVTLIRNTVCCDKNVVNITDVIVFMWVKTWNDQSFSHIIETKTPNQTKTGKIISKNEMNCTIREIKPQLIVLKHYMNSLFLYVYVIFITLSHIKCFSPKTTEKNSKQHNRFSNLQLQDVSETWQILQTGENLERPIWNLKTKKKVINFMSFYKYVLVFFREIKLFHSLPCSFC